MEVDVTELLSVNYTPDFSNVPDLDTWFADIENSAPPETSHNVSTVVAINSGDHNADTPTEDRAESTIKKGNKRSLANREAVRKYRKKQKERITLLEEENMRLTKVNQELLKRIQSLSGLEADIARVKLLLLNIGQIPFDNGNTTTNVNSATGVGVAHQSLLYAALGSSAFPSN